MQLSTSFSDARFPACARVAGKLMRVVAHCIFNYHRIPALDVELRDGPLRDETNEEAWGTGDGEGGGGREGW